MYVGLVDEIYFVPGELGIGLVEGYDSMGFEMSKPYLRAELENDLKRYFLIFVVFFGRLCYNVLLTSRICEGIKDPKVVLREQINKYREVFKKAVDQVS